MNSPDIHEEKNYQWTLRDLQNHLQAAIDLEFWTIPFYMTSMYSIKDASSSAYTTILSVVNQEMLHVQLACNIANAYGLVPKFSIPIYYGQFIPHLDFNLDDPDPRSIFEAYSAELGPFDPLRLNAMCLIEYPLWKGAEKSRNNPLYYSYGSIGEFYQAVAVGAEQLKDHIKPVNQVAPFATYYQNFAHMTVTGSGASAFGQVKNLIDAITTQGEGQTNPTTAWSAHSVPSAYRNTTDDMDPNWAHYQKFVTLWSADHYPDIYAGAADPGTAEGRAAQDRLVENFESFLKAMDALFSGGPTDQFHIPMYQLGGNILNCWRHGAIPKFGPHFNMLQKHMLTSGARRAFPPHERIALGARPLKASAKKPVHA